MATSTTPVFASTCNTRVQVRPPSSVRYRPRSSFAPHSCPIAATNTRLLFVGSITMRPMCADSRSPTFVNVVPPLVLLYTPSPQLELCRLARSPVPTHTMLVSRWSSAIAPMECTG
jgi:hypothetical protein